MQTKIKMIQRREDKCSFFSLEGLNIGRKGELKFLVISTDTEVFIFDIEYFGVNAFKWGLYSVLDNLIFTLITSFFNLNKMLLEIKAKPGA